jgi:hypothetical protein
MRGKSQVGVHRAARLPLTTESITWSLSGREAELPCRRRRQVVDPSAGERLAIADANQLCPFRWLAIRTIVPSVRCAVIRAPAPDGSPALQGRQMTPTADDARVKTRLIYDI